MSMWHEHAALVGEGECERGQLAGQVGGARRRVGAGYEHQAAAGLDQTGRRQVEVGARVDGGDASALGLGEGLVEHVGGVLAVYERPRPCRAR
jgi:hypothetical protein